MKEVNNMKYNMYQIIGSIIYIIIAVAIIIAVPIIPLDMGWRIIIIMVLLSGMLYASAILLNGILGSLFKIKDRELRKSLRFKVEEVLNDMIKKYAEENGIDLYENISYLFDISFETFASPLNFNMNRFCSIFYDTDKVFGGVGSFYNLTTDNLLMQNIKGVFFNPPYLPILMKKCVLQCLTILY